MDILYRGARRGGKESDKTYQGLSRMLDILYSTPPFELMSNAFHSSTDDKLGWARHGTDKRMQMLG